MVDFIWYKKTKTTPESVKVLAIKKNHSSLKDHLIKWSRQEDVEPAKSVKVIEQIKYERNIQLDGVNYGAEKPPDQAEC